MLSMKFPHLFLRSEIVITFLWGWEWSGGQVGHPSPRNSGCISCNEPFIVKHFLVTCTEFNHIRKKYYTAKTVKELFSDTPSEKIINFLKEINLFNKL